MRFWILAVVLALTAGASAAPKDDMMAADKAFSAMSVAKGYHAAFLAYMTDDVRLYQGDHPPIIGKPAATSFFATEEKSDADYSKEQLVWSPIEGEASPDGVLGYTRGTWSLTGPKKDGTTYKLTGYYVTQWRRQSDGSYKFCLDIGGADKH